MNPSICQNWTILCWIILHPLNKGLYNMPNPQEHTILTLLISKVSSKVHPRAQRTLNIDFQDSTFVPIFILNLIPLKMLSPLFLFLSLNLLHLNKSLISFNRVNHLNHSRIECKSLSYTNL